MHIIASLYMTRLYTGPISARMGRGWFKTNNANLDQVQNGKKIAALLDAQRVGGELIYTVLYQGKGPRKERIDSIPSSVLRKYANENFLDCLEQYALANCENHAFV
ncbi:unnamed protein product [Cylicostephanus goldi]|uniref:Uncharacterized protein n=1 Tax=Cylicostephanus goldi TaxID=71465 RepID=A0A3P6S1I0_CYLGO|nr:unnamed protein product [Cylicostephanus goldi]